MNDSRYYKRTIAKENIDSRHLHEQRNVKIFIPPGYNELVSYPAVYCQDGEQFFNFGRIATHAVRLILDEGMEPLFIIGVEADKTLRTSEYSPDGDRFNGYCRFFAEELIPFIEGKYSVRSAAEARVLAGDSLGGTVSLHLALDYPHLFEKVIALSGAFFEPTQNRLEREHDLEWMNLFMVVGLGEEAVETDRGTFDFLRMNRETKALLLQKQANLRYEEKQGKHIWGFWQNELPAALVHFFPTSSV